MIFLLCLAGYIGSQVLRDGGRFPGINQKVNLVEGVFAGRGSCGGILAVHSRCVQVAVVEMVVEI